MNAEEIINEIEKLSVDKQIFIAEKILSHIRKTESKTKMMKAAENLEEEYKANKELTEFTS